MTFCYYNINIVLLSFCIVFIVNLRFSVFVYNRNFYKIAHKNNLNLLSKN